MRNGVEILDECEGCFLKIDMGLIWVGWSV